MIQIQSSFYLNLKLLVSKIFSINQAPSYSDYTKSTNTITSTNNMSFYEKCT